MMEEYTSTGFTVLGCRLKRASGQPMESAKSLQLVAGAGIVGDANASRGSPRHVLVADERAYQEFDLPAYSLRENLLVRSSPGMPMKPGHILSAGSAVLRVTMFCEPCTKLNQVRPGLAGVIGPHRGFLARVIRSGRVAESGRLTLFAEALDSLPERKHARVHRALRGVPCGRVTTFRHLTIMAGLPKSYVRVLPRILKSAPSGVPVHRVVTEERVLISQHIPPQRVLLEEEGVRIIGEVVARQHIWRGDPYSVEEARLSRKGSLRRIRSLRGRTRPRSPR